MGQRRYGSFRRRLPRRNAITDADPDAVTHAYAQSDAVSQPDADTYTCRDSNTCTNSNAHTFSYSDSDRGTGHLYAKDHPLRAA